MAWFKNCFACDSRSNLFVKLLKAMLLAFLMPLVDEVYTDCLAEFTVLWNITC